MSWVCWVCRTWANNDDDGEGNSDAGAKATSGCLTDDDVKLGLAAEEAADATETTDLLPPPSAVPPSRGRERLRGDEAEKMRNIVLIGAA